MTRSTFAPTREGGMGPPPRDIVRYVTLDHTEACGVTWGTSCVACCKVFLVLWEADQRNGPQKPARRRMT